MGRVAVGVAHDLNNLLTVVLACSDSLFADFDPEDPRRADVVDIHRAAKIGASLTRRLLAIGRPNATGPRIVRPSLVVAESEGLLRRLVGPRVDLIIHVASDAGQVHADQGELEQVIMNLAANAGDAMPRGGTLVLEIANVDVQADPAAEADARATGRYVMLVVRDTGVGMPAEVLARVFEPFYTTKGSAHATGLGLAFVETIVAERGGFIRVESEPGVGTTFRVYLPCAHEERSGAAGQRSA
jgi:signal transduction histidine kinase